MSDTTRDLEEGNNDRTTSETGLRLKFSWPCALATVAWALGWAIFNCVLSQKVKGIPPGAEGVLLAVFSLYLLAIVIQLFGLFTGWSGDLNVVRARCLAVFLVLCRGLSFLTILYLGMTLKECGVGSTSHQAEVPGWCKLVKWTPWQLIVLIVSAGVDFFIIYGRIPARIHS